MAIDTNIMSAIKEAMLAKDEARLRTLRFVKSAFMLAKTEKGASGTLTEEQEIKIIQKLFNQRKESYSVYHQQGREELALKEKEEMDILESFLPKQMSDEELKSVLGAIIEQVGAKSPADMGKVMGVASKALAGKAEGGRISATVKELLAI
ncbi:MAG: GatB/YqeY domain-containing protein [Chitinophagales bacterium]|nr:GatB/YqeY domain-containing protein [Chitinophagales bacterium]MCZ2393969.1 GatB/YqeY domain-containing protein [Chitinophagales bacterium]